MSALGLSDRARILHAALQLPTFTVKQLVELTGAKESTVQTVLARSRDLLEEVEEARVSAQRRRGGRSIVYRVRDAVRSSLTQQAVELAESLRAPFSPSVEETIRRASVALNALSSTLELGALPDGHPDQDQDWRERAQSQLQLAQRLVALVTDPKQSRVLELKLSELEARLETPAGRFAKWAQHFSEVRQRAVAQGVTFDTSGWVEWCSENSQLSTAAPAMLLVAAHHGHDNALPLQLAAALKDARHRVLELDLVDAVLDLQVPLAQELLLETLKAPSHPTVYVTTDSGSQESCAWVCQFLDAARECLWLKNERPPVAYPDLVIIDADINPAWVQVDQVVRNLSYLPNVNDALSIRSLIQGMVPKTERDSSLLSCLPALMQRKARDIGTC